MSIRCLRWVNSIEAGHTRPSSIVLAAATTSGARKSVTAVSHASDAARPFCSRAASVALSSAPAATTRIMPGRRDAAVVEKPFTRCRDCVERESVTTVHTTQIILRLIYYII